MNSVLHDRIARIAREILRERFTSVEDQADAMAAAIIEDFDQPPQWKPSPAYTGEGPWPGDPVLGARKVQPPVPKWMKPPWWNLKSWLSIWCIQRSLRRNP